MSLIRRDRHSGPNEGPLAFDMPEFLGDQGQFSLWSPSPNSKGFTGAWTNWLRGMGVPADFANSGLPPPSMPAPNNTTPFWMT
jgi:hypothetical protein